jgi:aminopeptidase N
MLERYLGPAVFQRGVRRYIKRHRESNTVASDLWNALSEAAKQDVEKVVRPFLDQPGFPLVRVTLQRPKKTRNAKATAAAQPLRVQLSQERFAAEGPGASSHGSSVWPVPWVGRVGRGGRGGRGEQSTRATFTRTLLTKTKATVALPSGSVRYLYGNADEGGFFRPLHASADLPALLEALPELGVAERLGFVQHQWALLRAGYTGLADFLPLVSALAQEPDADVLRALHAPMEHLLDDIALSAGAATHARLRELIVRTFEPALRTLSWQARDGEPESERLRRAELVHLVAVLADNPSDCEEAEHQFQQYMASRAQLDPNLIGPVLTLGARRADAARLHQLLDASETDSTPQARRRFRLALADVREPELAETVLTLCLGPRIPTQDVAFVVARLLRNPAVQERAFEFIQTRWPELRERIPAMLMSRLIDAAPALRAERHRRSLQQFFRKHPLPTAARALRQADERFRLDAAFRKRAAPELRSLLSAAASPAERRSRR